MMLEGEKIFGSRSELGPIQVGPHGMGSGHIQGTGMGSRECQEEIEMSWLGDLGAVQDMALLENGMNSRLAQDRLWVLWDNDF